MKRLLLKIGKLWSLIQRDGFLRATPRAWGLVRSSFHRVGEGQILYITGGIGDSALYRGAHLVEELETHGFIASTTTQDNPFLLAYINRFDVFVLHRVSCSSRIYKFLDKAQQKGKTVLFETDDLTFDEQKVQKTNAYKMMNALEKAQYKGGQSHCVINHPSVTHATTTTEPLARHLRSIGKHVFVVPNKLSQEFIEMADKVQEQEESQEKNEEADEAFMIGYFSGTASHDFDFAVVSNGLLKILEEFGHVRLFIAGPLTLDKRFDQFSSRIIYSPYVSREEHFTNIARCDINIAPLEVGDNFCESKSAIKYYEAGIMSVPIIASDTEVFATEIRDGETGFVAKDSNQWYEKIKRCVQDSDLCERIGNAARKDVLDNHTTHTKGNAEYYDFLRQAIDGSIDEDIIPLRGCAPEVDTVIVIVNWNLKDLLQKCVQSLQSQTDQNFTIIVVDNGSTDGSLEMIKDYYKEVSWIAFDHNTGFAHPTNAGFRAALTNKNIKNVIALNNDSKCDKDYIKNMRVCTAKLDSAKKGSIRVGALQPKVLNYYNQSEIDTTGVVTSCEMSAKNRGIGQIDTGQFDDAQVQNVFGPSGSAALYTREALEKTMLPHAGYFDKDYFAYYEDVDLAWRLHSAGFDVQYVSNAKVYHVHSATGGNASSFKAFHIHRNHFYNMLKNAPLYYLPILFLLIIYRYVLTLISICVNSGPAARLKSSQEKKQNNTQTKNKENIFTIVLRSWYEVVKNFGSTRRKREFIASRRVRSSRSFFQVLRHHHISLISIIFK